MQNYTAEVAVEEPDSTSHRVYQVGLFDTAGQEEFDSLRVLAYPHTDIFLLCYCVLSFPSYRNVKEKWVPEIRRHCPSAPIILVGTQVDRRGW